MNASLIDANCLVSFVTERNLSQQQAIASILNEASELKRRILVISNVVTEFVYALRITHGQSPSSLRQMVGALLIHPGIEYVHSYDLGSILEIWPRPVRDYGDAVLAAAAIETGAPIITFDKRFSRQLARMDIAYEVPQ